jgi:hypothetical protein
MSRWMHRAALALTLLPLACGATTRTQESDSGNTNWLKSCDTDQECGDLSCTCGKCRTACAGASDCSLPPADSCLAPASNNPGPPAPVTLREHRDPDSYANDLAIGDSNSILLVGGTDVANFDLSLIYPTFWLRVLDDQGEERWTYVEPPTDGQPNTGRSVAPGAYGEVLALSTIYDGSDTPAIRRFQANGQLLDNWTASPGYTALRSDQGGFLYATGSKLNEFRDGRPFTAAWMGRLDAKEAIWEHERSGTDGSISNIVASASDFDGNLVIGGSLGTAYENNASEPYLARLDHEGNFIWEESISLAEETHCDATAVALTKDGGSLAAIGCGPRWVRGYDLGGAVRWERRFAEEVTALAGLGDGGYVVALGGDEAVLRRFDAEHELLWEATQAGCTAFTRVAATAEGVVALAGCEPGFVVTWFADP